MLNTPRHPVERRDEHDIKSASSCVCHQSVETGTLRLRAADYVRVLVNYFESALLRELTQIE
jgi:hypothetical protein